MRSLLGENVLSAYTNARFVCLFKCHSLRVSPYIGTQTAHTCALRYERIFIFISLAKFGNTIVERQRSAHFCTVNNTNPSVRSAMLQCTHETTFAAHFFSSVATAVQIFSELNFHSNGDFILKIKHIEWVNYIMESTATVADDLLFHAQSAHTS